MEAYRSLQSIKDGLKRGELTLSALVEGYLARMEATRDLNIYVEVFAAEAKARAKTLDEQYAKDPAGAGPLHGLVVSIKDVICYAGHQVTGGSKILEGFRSLFSSTAVERLLNAGAIILGRVNCDEFAMGSTNETSVYGPTRHGADPSKIPGGSSGASAVSVQTGTCLASLGSDTGGSVRQPAAFCGVVGFKPSYGRISRHGLLAYGSSFDQIGILAHHVEDVAKVLECIAGPDAYDSTAIPDPPEAYSSSLAFQGPARIAYLDTAINHPNLDPGVRNRSLHLIGWLREAGHTVEEVSFEYLDYLIPAYYVLTTAEASSNLSRYDGMRFGYRSKEAGSLEATYKKSRTEGFGREVKRRIMLGAFVLSSGYYDAYYSRAQKVRRLIRDRTEAILKEYDFILMPTAPGTAWNLGESLEDPVTMYLADVFTVQANMAGIPAIALPAGLHENGLPIGIQFMAGFGQEGRLLAFGHYFQNHYPVPDAETDR
ncbi:MAG: Asp-tRNA(Asn)/Glu-tRNA(Gln) amidotransferase subunit GatA [Haliscomenobacter sp.]|nr:Asp-tRNA(Asn)/Glu-tRNA(Gln) amidotransferase subunit GatA [Haliscomenobacter sp.]